MQPRTRTALTGIVMVGSLLVAGCGGSSSTSGSSANTAAADVTVRAEDALRFDQQSYTAAAGTVTIAYVNDGSQPHTLLIDKNKDFKKLGVDHKGQRVTGTATLTPGTYTIYCDIPGHRSAGMEAKLVVN